MKKALLLAATGALAFTGAQAADMPGAPHPVDYVRICDTYGNGFYYIPGSDTCLRVFGVVRADYWNSNAEAQNGDKSRSNTFRARAYLRHDSRTETEAGLLRTYTDLWITSDNSAAGSVILYDAFVQYGNWTFGKTASPYGSYYHGSGVIQSAAYGSPFAQTNMVAYTSDLGEGMSSTIALEMDGTTAVATGFAATNRPTNPVVVGNFKMSMDWGSVHFGLAARHNKGNVGAVAVSETGFAANLGARINVGEGYVYLLTASSAGYNSRMNLGANNVINDFYISGGNVENNEISTFAIGGSTSVGEGLTAGIDISSYSGDQVNGGADVEGSRVAATLSWAPVSGLVFLGNLDFNSIKDGSDTTITTFRVQRDY